MGSFQLLQLAQVIYRAIALLLKVVRVTVVLTAGQVFTLKSASLDIRYESHFKSVKSRNQAVAKAGKACSRINLPAKIVSKLSKNRIFWGKNMKIIHLPALTQNPGYVKASISKFFKFH